MYGTTCKKLIIKTPFRLVYGQESIMPIKFIVLSSPIAMLEEITESGIVKKGLSELVEIEEYWFIIGFHQQVQKVHEKSWHDRNIKQNKF
jgi:hypothetical protein